MKKLLLVIAMVAVSFTANAQKEGLNVGADVTYAFDAEVFGLMAEANYLFEVSDEFRAGPTVSYQYLFGKSIETPLGTITRDGHGSFVAGAAGRFDATDEVVLGVDLGYHTDAEVFYYRPLVGYKLNEKTMVQLSYPATTGGGSLALGIMFGL